MRPLGIRIPGVALLAAALPLAMIASLAIGFYPVPPARVATVLASAIAGRAHAPGAPAPAEVVVLLVRLPRVAAATLAGVALGLSGAALQGLFRNPLVGPDLVGASSGSACGAAFAILLGWAAAAVVGTAFAGGLFAVAAAAALARAGGGGGLLRIVLAGVLVSAFGGALLGLAQFLADPNTTLPAIVFWLMGSFAAADRSQVLTMAAATAVGGSVVLLLRWRINLLSLGELDAAALGVRTDRLRWAVIAAVALMVAAQVAVSGIVGWVGLIVPHMARAVVGPDHRKLLPAAGLVGGLFTLLVDDLARTVGAQEIPVGLLTALVGTPAFALLFWRTQRGGWSER